MRSAWSGVQCSSSTPNSSPPRRASTSLRAHARLQEAGDLTQELVARGVPAGVVHDLELVEVDVNHGVADRLVRACRFDRAGKAALEFAPVDETRQRVVRRLV